MAEKRRSRRAAADGVRGAGWTARQAGALHLEATERAWPLFRARSKSYERTWLSRLGVLSLSLCVLCWTRRGKGQGGCRETGHTAVIKVRGDAHMAAVWGRSDP